MLGEMVDTIDPMTPRSVEEALPEVACLLKAYEAKKCRKALGRRSIKSRMSRKGKDSSRSKRPEGGKEQVGISLGVSYRNLLRPIDLFSNPSSFTTARLRGRPTRAPGSIEEQTG
jgi:hypothetical protein